MAKFLNTSAINYFLEELIKNTNDKLVLISPFLKLNSKIKELLEDKDRLKIDIRIVYGKVALENEEKEWLNKLNYIRTSFCSNLHAKCYMNEETCIVTSMNLYEFSQINNNEMGILITKKGDEELYDETKKEVDRIIRISNEVKISSKSVKNDTYKKEKVKTSKLAQKYKIKTDEMIKLLIKNGYLELRNNKPYLTERGKENGGEWKPNKFGGYFLWNENIKIK